MENVIRLFIDLLDKKESNYFKDFLNTLPNKGSWYLISDYCIGNSDKYNDVITFSLLYSYDNSDNIKEHISNYASKDLKRTSEISDNFIDYLNSLYLYHFSLVIRKKENLLADWLNKAPLDKIIDWMADVFEQSKGTDLEKSEYYNQVQERLKKFTLEIKRKGYNKKLIREILLTSSFGASIIYMLKKYSSPNQIGWVSDRDAIIDRFDGLAFDNMLFWYKRVSDGESFSTVDPEFIFLEPEKVGPNYFDELVRIPDFIAGSLASFDFDNVANNIEIKDKYKQMYMYVFTNSINHAIIKAECKDNGISLYNFKIRTKNNCP